jgi:hypothetical protein
VVRSEILVTVVDDFIESINAIWIERGDYLECVGMTYRLASGIIQRQKVDPRPERAEREVPT